MKRTARQFARYFFLVETEHGTDNDAIVATSRAAAERGMIRRMRRAGCQRINLTFSHKD